MTRDSWHRVAEHVLAAAQYAQTGHIALRPAPGGFQTTHPLNGGRMLSIVGTELVIDDSAGRRTAPLTTVAAAADFVGMTPGMPASVYSPATPLALDEPLRVDPDGARVLAGWYQLADAALRRLIAVIGAAPQEPILWPEHFDIGVTVEAVNYGASPGDSTVADPYLYVGPHAGPPVRDNYWNVPFGATKTMAETPSVAKAVTFFCEGLKRLA